MPVTDGRTNGGGGKWKIEQYSVGPETAIIILNLFPGEVVVRHCLRGFEEASELN